MWSHFSPISHSSKFNVQKMYSLGNCIEYYVNVKIDTSKNHFYVYNSIVKAISKFSYFQRKKASLENTVLQQIGEGVLLHYKENTSIAFPNMWKSCLIGAIIALRINNTLTSSEFQLSIIQFVQCTSTIGVNKLFTIAC